MPTLGATRLPGEADPCLASFRAFAGIPAMFFEDLNAFVKVVEHGSFSKAAIDLSIAQSALSKRVQRLEAKLGAALLVRRSRGVTLTDAGRALLIRAKKVMDDVVDIENNLSSIAPTVS